MVRSPALPVALLALALAACTPDRPAGDGQATDDATADAPAADIPPATAPPAAAPAPATGRARFDGYGDLRFGMTEAEGRDAWSGTLNGDAGAGTGDACHYLNPASDQAPSYFAFMFEGGRFVRYDVGNDEEIAPGGGRRGMDAAEIRALYPERITESPHKYVEGGQYLRIPAAQGDGVLVFETDAAGKVSEWHAGLAPQVDYIEGCS
jgi:hypothetical protein